MAKKLLFIILLLAVAGGASAQKKRPWCKPFYDAEPYHFGFAFSLGQMSFSISHSDEFNLLDTFSIRDNILLPLIKRLEGNGS